MSSPARTSPSSNSYQENCKVARIAKAQQNLSLAIFCYDDKANLPIVRINVTTIKKNRIMPPKKKKKRNSRKHKRAKERWAIAVGFETPHHGNGPPLYLRPLFHETPKNPVIVV